MPLKSGIYQELKHTPLVARCTLSSDMEASGKVPRDDDPHPNILPLSSLFEEKMHGMPVVRQRDFPEGARGR